MNKNLAEKIKKIIVLSIYSEDELFDQLVLKGGNAIALIHQQKIRKSIDVDFSIAADFPGGYEFLKNILEKSLMQGFNQSGYKFFDFNFKETPKNISQEMKNFWGGYSADFKLIDIKKYQEIDLSDKTSEEKLEAIRRNAIALHGSTKIEIDISKHEIVSNKIEKEIEGVKIYAYSVEMIVAEKFRAICQQHFDYGLIVKRGRNGTPRPKDFFDIHLLISQFNIDMLSKDNLILMRAMFEIKNVPIEILCKLDDQKKFHGDNFYAVTASLEVDKDPEEKFDFYFYFVKKIAESIYNEFGK